jgi:hypothetical protein
MPRPELTADYIQRLEEHYQEFMDDPPEGCVAIPGERFKEMFMAGDWLGDRLHASGAEEQEIKDITFAFGQRCFGQPDVWETAKAALRRYWEGRADKPGMKLAEEICSEVLGGDMKDMLDERQKRRNAMFDKYTKFID